VPRQNEKIIDQNVCFHSDLIHQDVPFIVSPDQCASAGGRMILRYRFLVLLRMAPMITSKIFPSVFRKGGALVACACFFASTCAYADIVSPSASVTITQSYAYTNFDGGDFVFSTSASAPGCGSGWYINAADPGYKVAVATALTAQAGGNYVSVYGDNTDLWAGSPSGHYCRVQTIGITS
jgi:hypothetical protein